MGKYNDISFGKAEAVFNKLGGKGGINDFLSGKVKLIPSKEEVTPKHQMSEKCFYLGSEGMDTFHSLLDEEIPSVEVNQYPSLITNGPFYPLEHGVVFGYKSIVKDPTQIASEILAILRLPIGSILRKLFLRKDSIWYFENDSNLYEVSLFDDEGFTLMVKNLSEGMDKYHRDDLSVGPGAWVFFPNS